jgi:hypothetical protein
MAANLVLGLVLWVVVTALICLPGILADRVGSRPRSLAQEAADWLRDQSEP